MSRILQTTILIGGIIYFLFILYIFFSPTEKVSNETSKKENASTKSFSKQKNSQLKTPNTPTTLKTPSTFKKATQNTKNNKTKNTIEKIVYVQMCPTSGQKINTKKKIDSYVLCGDNIQTCPPPMPPAKCSCKASNNFFNMFNGTQ
jgi:hypothetical protein